MNYFVFFILFMSLFGSLGEELNAQQYNDKIFPVGMTARSFVDSTRQNWQKTGLRPLHTTIWYPSASQTQHDTIYIGSPVAPLFFAGIVEHESSLSRKKERYPLVLLSHGTGGSALQMMWLGTYLAAHGYIVAAVNHHGNTAAEDNYAPQGFVLWWERTRDLSIVIDRLLSDAKLGRHIDDRRIGAAGFSLGGYTVISLGGGITDLQAFEDFCSSPHRDATCDPQSEFPDVTQAFEQVKDDPQVQHSLMNHNSSFKDDQIRAIFAIAPALGGAFSKDGFAQIEIPVHIVVGTADSIAPVATNAGYFAGAIEKAQLTMLENVTHYTFLAECTELGKIELPLYCANAKVERSVIHQQVARLALQFFIRTL